MNLVAAIEEYIHNKRINYAIMINGEWGSGKTYFIKKNILRRYTNALYVSLYDVTSTDKLSEKIYFELLKSKYVKNPIIRFAKCIYNKLIFKILFFIPATIFKFMILIIKSIIGIIFKIIGLFTLNIGVVKFDINVSSLKKIDYYGALKLIKKLDEYVLIIDDLERCGISIEEVLGFLNDLVEHRDMKCIIIANEDEIDKTISKNLELKVMSVVNEKIEFYDTDRKPDKYSKKSPNKIDSEDIKNRIEYLYNEHNKYKIIKEKLIGKVFRFVPALDEVYDNLAYKYNKDEEFYLILCNTKTSVINIMKMNNFNNIRTLDFYFENFYHIYNYSKEAINKCHIDHKFIYNSLSTSIINGCIAIKRGENLNMLSSDKQYDYISYGKEQDSIFSSKLHLTFDFVNEYLLYNCIEKTDVEKTVKVFESSNCDKLSPDDPFNYLTGDFLFNSSNDIEKNLKSIKRNIKNHKYNPSLYNIIIKQLSYLESIGFKSSEIDKIINNIKNNIENGEEIQLESHPFFSNAESANFYKEHIEEIKIAFEKNTKKKVNSTFDKIFSNTNWGENFYKYIVDNKDNYILNKRFLSELDLDKIINLLFNTEIKDIYYFKYSLDSIYDSANIKDFYTSDIDDLRKLKEKLEKRLENTTIDDPMRQYPFKILSEKITEIIEKSI